jgi:hypothetical protein
MKPIISQHFAKPPYRAELVNPSWACVLNSDGINCLSFEDKPGAKFTTLENAKKIAEEWNAKKD